MEFYRRIITYFPQRNSKNSVSNSPEKLRLVETCQHEFHENLNTGHACNNIIMEHLQYSVENLVKTAPKRDCLPESGPDAP